MMLLWFWIFTFSALQMRTECQTTNFSTASQPVSADLNDSSLITPSASWTGSSIVKDLNGTSETTSQTPFLSTGTDSVHENNTNAPISSTWIDDCLTTLRSFSSLTTTDKSTTDYTLQQTSDKSTTDYTLNQTTAADRIWLTTTTNCSYLTTNIESTTESNLNISSAFDQYWVITVIQVPTSVDVHNVTFQRQMEERLASVYNEAMNLPGQTSSRRRKRAATVGNATVQITNITRGYSGNVENTELIYFLVENNDYPNITSAQQTVALMNLLVQVKSLQYVTLALGYIVIVAAEPYIVVTNPTSDTGNNLWIIGVVFGSLFALILLIWCILFVYIKVTRPPKRFYSTRASTHPHLDSLENQNANAIPVKAKMSDVTVQTADDAMSFEYEMSDKRNSLSQSQDLHSGRRLEELIIVAQDDKQLGAKRKKQKNDATGNALQKKKRRRKKKVVRPIQESEIMTESDAAIVDSSPELNDSQTSIAISEISSAFEISTKDDPMETSVHHTPMYLPPIPGKPVQPWNPYAAADISRQILASSSVKEPYLFESEVVALGKTPLRKSPTNLLATETPTMDSRHRTMAALRRAGLIPPDDYTRLTLDTRTFSAVDSSLRDLTLNRPTHSSDITSDMPDDFRLGTPFSELDIQHNGANKFNWG